MPVQRAAGAVQVGTNRCAHDKGVQAAPRGDLSAAEQVLTEVENIVATSLFLPALCVHVSQGKTGLLIHSLSHPAPGLLLYNGAGAGSSACTPCSAKGASACW